ncbi:MAG: hypothetical protein FWB83_08485 [Treponema sp.]|nr:hypothetical protein [Treponema sp.]
MDMKPTCACKGTEFTCKQIGMPNGNFWYPIICKNCGAIAGQLPSGDDQKAVEQVVGELSTIMERLDNIQTILYDTEERLKK